MVFPVINIRGEGDSQGCGATLGMEGVDSMENKISTSPPRSSHLDLTFKVKQAAERQA
jgi:hypothetical protein